MARRWERCHEPRRVRAGDARLNRRDEVDVISSLRQAAAHPEEAWASGVEPRDQRGELRARVHATEGNSDHLVAPRQPDRVLAHGQQQRRQLVGRAKRLQLDAQRDERRQAAVLQKRGKRRRRR